MTYTVSVSRNFRATHWMPNGKSAETVPHQHDYRLQLAVHGARVGDDGLLMDIDVLSKGLDDLVERLSGAKVNDMSEIHGLPPSLENFAAAIWMAALPMLKTDRLDSMTVTLWESEDAYASFAQELRH